MAKLVDGFKDGKPELGRRTFLVPENHSEVLALLYHEQTGIVGGLPVGPVTTDPFGAHGIRMYPAPPPRNPLKNPPTNATRTIVQREISCMPDVGRLTIGQILIR